MHSSVYRNLLLQIFLFIEAVQMLRFGKVSGAIHQNSAIFPFKYGGVWRPRLFEIFPKTVLVELGSCKKSCIQCTFYIKCTVEP